MCPGSARSSSTRPLRFHDADTGSGSRADEAPKSLKDLLYLRELMATGREVVETMERDIEDAASSGYEADVRTARDDIYLLLHGALRRRLPGVAEMLAARDGPSRAAAAADVKGHLVELIEVLDATLDRPAEQVPRWTGMFRRGIRR